MNKNILVVPMVYRGKKLSAQVDLSGLYEGVVKLEKRRKLEDILAGQKTLIARLEADIIIYDLVSEK